MGFKEIEGMDIFRCFVDRVKNTPKEIMIYDGEREISFDEVFQMVNYYSERILEKTGGRRKRILLQLEHSYRIIICILSILKTGNSYVPIAKDASVERIKKIGEYCSSNIIMTDTQHFYDMNEIYLGEDVCNQEGSFDYFRFNNKDEVYVLFTSGSTGKPKGCSISYRNLCYIMRNMLKIGAWNSSSRICFSTPYTFDVSTTEIYGFVYGAGIYVCNTAKTDLFKRFPYIVFDNKITHLALSPSSLKNMFNAYTNEQLDLMGEALKCVMVAGEAFKKEIYYRWSDSGWNYRLLNLYGPTEATVYATGYELHKGDVYENSIPIGKTLDGCVYYIDKEDKNGVGELVLGGEGVASGYINNPDEHKKRFIMKDNMLYYRTGDLVSLDNDILYYHGRNDDQVQINGIRVELGEIESRINELDEIKENVVLYYNGILIAFLIMQKNMVFSISEIRSKLLKRMPRYMIPNSFKKVDKFQLNESNKIDRKRVLEDYLKEKNKSLFTESVDSDCELVLRMMKDCLEDNGAALTINDDFFEFGGDSLNTLLLITKLESAFQVTLDSDIIYSCRSCKKIVQYIDEMIKNSRMPIAENEDIVYDMIIDLTKQVKHYLYNNNNFIKCSYEAMYIQKYYYDRKLNSPISFKYEIGTDYTLAEVKEAILKLLLENSILNSKIRVKDDWVYFDEFEPEKLEIPVIELPYENRMFIDFIIKNYSEELFYSRYSRGFLSLFILVKIAGRITVIGMLDHTIADGASVSILKLKIGDILNNKNHQETIAYRDYCQYIRSEQCNIDTILDNWYMKLLDAGKIKNKKQLLESRETKTCHYVLENIQDDSNTSIIKCVGYWLGKKLHDWIENECVALRCIINLRDYCNVSLKSTLGDLHASLSFFYCRGDSYNMFSDRVEKVISLLGDFCSHHSLYIEDNRYSDETRVGELTNLIDDAEFISISYQGVVTDEELVQYEKEMSEAHSRLSSANARLFVTVFYNRGNVHIFLNKKIF